MRRHAATLLFACALAALGPPVFATENGFPEDKARAFVTEALNTWAADPVLISAVLAQNLRHAGLTQADIDRLDQGWMSELGASVQPTISSVLGTPASDMLRNQVELAAGSISEVFVMDSLGLNVASAGTTSDYWQGDEAKFQETYPKGPGALHIGEVEFDESSQAYQVQVSFSLTDPADGSVIGAVTVALNAEQF
ncbi:PDC sensor domain-containing protein [Pseudotabrizicola formosa]|uniref:PDC sensor domain-containing protein n=1 Tax=Pseudotabrizicola formosa TaxID=2030009 RepID=UPI000CD03035|nr:PDC sensor domain-containing protein [Pseudotabrizicola formosa]